MLFRLFSKKVFFPQLSSFHPEFSLDCMAILIFSFMHLKILLTSTHFQSHFHTFRYLLPQHPTSQYQFPSYYAWASIIKYDKWLKISHVLEPRVLRSRYQLIQYLVWTLFMVCRWPPSSHGGKSKHSGLFLFLQYKDTNSIMEVPPLQLNLNLITPKSRTSKYHNIGGLELQHLDFGERGADTNVKYVKPTLVENFSPNF